MMSRNLFRATGTAFLLAGLLASPVQATDIWWVSPTGDDLGGSGTSGSPYRTISRAMVQAAPHDVIKVLSGDYGVADGEAFPIAIKHGVDIIGQEASPANYPRIGGDVEDGDVRALFEVVADSADRTGILISGLRFVGEDTANEDAPSAIYVENADGYKASVAVEHCIIERSRMNDSGSSGRPAVLGLAGAAEFPENSEDASVSLTLSLFMCTITPSDAGGVKVDVSANATPTNYARSHLVVSRCSFIMSGSQTAPSAIDLLVRAWGGGETARHIQPTCEILANTIDARGCAGAGLAEGIVIGGEARHGGLVNFDKSMVKLAANEIRGTSVAAIRFEAFQDDDEGSSISVRSWDTERNILMDNAGDGLVVRQGSGSEHVYFNFRFKGNLIADNAGSALLFDGIDNVSGDTTVTSNTLAGNAGYGVEVAASDMPEFLYTFQNNIVWDNGLGSGSGWDPTVDPNVFTHNDWQGLFGLSPACTPDGDDNVDADPGFVNAAAGDYHLADTSCVIAKGTNSPVTSLTEHDIDAEDRVYGARVDIDADEYHPEE